MRLGCQASLSTELFLRAGLYPAGLIGYIISPRRAWCCSWENLGHWAHATLRSVGTCWQQSCPSSIQVRTQGCQKMSPTPRPHTLNAAWSVEKSSGLWTPRSIFPMGLGGQGVVWKLFFLESVRLCRDLEGKEPASAQTWNRKVVGFCFFSAPHRLQDLCSLTRDWTWTTPVKAPSPDHWTAWEPPLKNYQNSTEGADAG